MTRWMTPSAAELPHANEVHIWRIGLDQPAAVVAQAEALLHADEGERANRLLLAAERRRFVLMRAALRSILAGYLTVAPADIGFELLPGGKPALAEPLRERLKFNLSHAGEYGLLACRCGAPVGVDLEPSGPVELDTVAAMVLSPREASTLAGLPPFERQAAFFRAWVRKEAYLKATGRGITTDLGRISVELDPRRPPALLDDRDDPGASQRWSVFDLAVAEGYSAALVTLGNNTQIVYQA